MTPATIGVRYALFAVAATTANLAAQWLVLARYDGKFGLGPAIAAGTLVGLITKYILDKRWIHYDLETGIRAHGRKFFLYSAMGVSTTAIFWVTELAFDALFGQPAMKYLGAVLGLSLGYTSKYYLDRHFVFRRAEQ